MGYTETSLQEHVTSEHAETSTEVICPICAALPGGDPNHVTDDFAAHLTLEHRAPRDLISFRSMRVASEDSGSGCSEASVPDLNSSNLLHIYGSLTVVNGQGKKSMCYRIFKASGAERGFRKDFSGEGLQNPMIPSQGLRNSVGSSWEEELLSQLSGVRRSAGGQLNSSGPSASQLQQLQMQLQLERQHAQAARQQLETARNASRRTNTSSVTTTITQSTATANTANTEHSQQALQSSQFLLTRKMKSYFADKSADVLERTEESVEMVQWVECLLHQPEKLSSDPQCP
ncbi:hypothetical protein STEG23_000300 [Scotinomys teguina]